MTHSSHRARRGLLIRLANLAHNGPGWAPHRAENVEDIFISCAEISTRQAAGAMPIFADAASPLWVLRKESERQRPEKDAESKGGRLGI